LGLGSDFNLSLLICVFFICVLFRVSTMLERFENENIWFSCFDENHLWIFNRA
jgi:hypothetical protein